MEKSFNTDKRLIQKETFSMIHKKLLTPVSVTALSIFALAIVLVQLRGTPLQGLLNEIFALALYALLIASYLLRVVLVLLGVFAVYRILREHVNGRDYKQVEVEIGLK